MQRTLFIVALIFLALAVAWPLLSKFPWGRLPGDFTFRGDSYTIRIPLATCLLLSLLLTLVLNLWRRF
jgi:hypothetical protein